MKKLSDIIDEHCLQIVKSGYQWREEWEVRVPAPGGHYMETAERVIGWGSTAGEAIEKALKSLGYLDELKPEDAE